MVFPRWRGRTRGRPSLELFQFEFLVFFGLGKGGLVYEPGLEVLRGNWVKCLVGVQGVSNKKGETQSGHKVVGETLSQLRIGRRAALPISALYFLVPSGPTGRSEGGTGRRERGRKAAQVKDMAVGGRARERRIYTHINMFWFLSFAEKVYIMILCIFVF